RGKKSLALDWSHQEALDLLLDLARTADIVLENFGTSEILARRGLDYESVRAVRPDVIYLSVSAFGRNSPWANKPGFDYIAQAASGIMHMTGDPDGPPSLVWSALGDTNSAVHGFAALGHALYHRERTGEGQFIDLSMTDCLFHFHEIALSAHHLSDGDYVPRRMGAHHDLVFPAGVFQGPEGWLVVLALDLQWPNLCRALGRSDWMEDPRYIQMKDRMAHVEELVAYIESWMATFDTDQAVLDHLEEHRVPASPVLSPLDALGHPHFEARDMVRWVDDPMLGRVPIPGFPWKFGAQPELPDLVAPTLGEHNVQVLRDKLGYDDARIDQLTIDGVIVSGSS
ncbi:MAG: CoA transferase, partial [Actinomycetota bacterium]|nr:CoA transferase [Actinomycetota bacterium]